MGIEIEGMGEVILKLERLGQDGRKIGNQGLKAGAKIILDYQKKMVPKGETKRGLNSLKISNIKTSSRKNRYVQVGGLRGAPWENIRGIYFQNYGYRNARTGKYHAPTLWLNKAFNAAKGQAQAALKNSIVKELKL